MRIVTRPLAVAGLLTLLCSISSAQTPSRAVVIARVDSIMKAGVATQITGAQVAVVKGRDTIMLRGYGHANVELDVAMTTDHVLRIGSLTKQFTSAAILQLVEQGRLKLEDPISKYIDNTPTRWSDVRVSHLLTHTSGIQSFTELVSMRHQLDRMGTSPDSMVQLMAQGSMMFEPGTGFYYNNGGYYLLGMIIEKVTGRAYADYIAQMVLPLGLTHTRYCDSAPIIAGRVSGYNREPTGRYTNADYVDMSTPFASGALCSTARDIVVWSDALTSGRVVHVNTFRQMITPVQYGSIRRGTYGMGITADSISGRLVVSHTGSINGFSAMLLHVPADSLIVAVLTNTAGAWAPELGRRIVRAVLNWPEPRVALLDQPVSDAERRALVGRYRVALPDGRRSEMTITDDAGRLMLRLPNAQVAMPLHRQSPEMFGVPGQAGVRVWVDIRDGIVREVVFDNANRPIVGRPVR